MKNKSYRESIYFMTAEGCLTVQSQFGIENAFKALKTLYDEIQQRGNKMSTAVQ